VTNSFTRFVVLLINAQGYSTAHDPGQISIHNSGAVDARYGVIGIRDER
jgi:hypothetical protein